MFIDYYKALQVDPECDSDIIGRMRKIFALKYHPDKAPEFLKDEYTKKMQQINSIIDILIDPLMRKKYDKTHPYFNTETRDKSYASTTQEWRGDTEEYRYINEFSRGIRKYITAENFFKAAKKAKKRSLFRPFDRKQFYYFGKRIERNQELSEWQSQNIEKYIQMALKENLI